MNRIFLLLAAIIFFCFGNVCFAATPADNTNNLNQKIITEQKETIQQLLQKVSSLTVVNAQQEQVVSHLNQQITILSQQIQQLTQQNLLLQSTITAQIKQLQSVQQMVTRKARLADFRAKSFPTLTSILLKNSQKQLICTQGVCHWDPLLTYFSILNTQNFLTNVSGLFIPKNFIFIILGVLIILIVVTILLIFYKTRKSVSKAKKYQKKLSDKEISSVAGEDIQASKLDLARAYIDMEDFVSALKILEDVKINGSEAQKTEAQRLLQEISIARH